MKHAFFTGNMLKIYAIHYRSVNSCQSVWRTVCGFEFVTRLQPDTTFKHPTIVLGQELKERLQNGIAVPPWKSSKKI